MINKIHIFGASGSGTTTLASSLTNSLGCTHFDTDDFFWIKTDPPFLKIRPIDERKKMLFGELKKHDHWILSGSLCGWGDELIPFFDVVIFLYVPNQVRMKRIKQRESERYGDRVAAGGDMHNQSSDFLEWAKSYDDPDTSNRSLKLHNSWIEKLTCPVLRIEGVNSVESNLDKVFNYIKSFNE